jgi:tetratricopeptide (TPR) repeat protein
MKGMPQDKWGALLSHYQELYGNDGDYATQLKALEKARDENASDPAIRFLLGYHYFYTGSHQAGFNELDKAVQLQPLDTFARQLRNLAADKVGAPKISETPPMPPQNNNQGPLMLPPPSAPQTR